MRKAFFFAGLLVFGSCLAIALAVLPMGQWWRLQRQGEVPETASQRVRGGASDWQIAQWTTWWGKRIDPEAFWRDRVIWNDETAQAAARRRGRAYPPVPEHMTHLIAGFPLHSRSRADIVPDRWGGGPDSGGVLPGHYTDAEIVYWDWFWRTKPKPPRTLESEQFDAAESILRMRGEPTVNGGDRYAKIQAQRRADSEKLQKRRAQEIGVPEEALTDEALFWAYVIKQREGYAEKQTQAAQWKAYRADIGELFIERFLDQLLVDRKWITEPLNAEQLEAANAWKKAYLRRLRREGTDESYINAYLAAWKLDRASVFQGEVGK